MRKRFGQIWMRLRLGIDIFRSVSAALEWISTIAQDDTVIRIEFPDYSASFQFSFPLRAGDRPRRLRKKDTQEPAFVIRHPAPPKDDSWARVFAAPDLEVLEKKPKPENMLPLRFGLSQHEKHQALSHARRHVGETLRKTAEKNTASIPPRFFLPADVNVALWVRGALRGSWIIEGRSFKEGIEKAVEHVLVDPRFKPLSLDELGDVRIEIGILHAPHITLAERDIRDNHIFPEKGYVLSAGKQKGWFLPEVLNVRRHSGLKEFIATLAEEKAHVSARTIRAGDVRIFEVSDFIESEDRTSAITLFATMPEPKNSSTSDRDTRFRAAADWLVLLQEEDGNFPPIVNPLTGRTTQVDWVRLAFTSWALAEYGAAMNECQYISAAEKAFGFLKHHLFDGRSIPQSALAYAYFGRLALAHSDTREAHTAAAAISTAVPTLTFDPIVFAHVAGFLSEMGHSETSALLIQALDDTYVLHQKNGTIMSGAAWAEYAQVIRKTNPTRAREVHDWLTVQQQESGAFSESTASDFIYTRGTGKIVEVLATESARNQTAIAKALAWLFSMQYTLESSFCIPHDSRARVLGGFRHDYLNHETWIDAAGHVLLAAARLHRTNS